MLYWVGVCSLVVEVEIVDYSLLVRWSWSLVVTLFGRGVCGCLAMGLPLGCEAVFERGVRYSLVVKILLGGSPRWTR